MMTVNDHNSSATLGSTITTTGTTINHRHHHNNSDGVTTEDGDEVAANAGTGDALTDIGDDAGNLSGGAGLAAVDPTALSGSGPPVLAGGGNSVDYAQTGPPVPIDQGITVTDSNMVTGATATISSGFFIGDMLNYTPNGIYANITGSYDAFMGVLTLTGNASAAAYQAALQSITFTSTNGNPSNSFMDDYRSVTWQVTDSTGPSNPVSSVVIVGLLDGVEGAFIVYDIRNNAFISVQNLVQASFVWQVAGFGDFSGNLNESDMLLQNSSTGAFELYDISKNTVYTASLLSVSYPTGTFSQWTVAGFGDFSGKVTNSVAESDMLLRNSTTGQFEVYDIFKNVVTSSVSLATVGLAWTVAGIGDFSTNANESDMLLRNSSTGQFEFYDISNNAITSLGSLGTVGLEWTVAGFGDFSGSPNETDMMLRNSNTGAFEVYDINKNQITGVFSIGTVGLEWQIAIRPIWRLGRTAR